MDSRVAPGRAAPAAPAAGPSCPAGAARPLARRSRRSSSCFAFSLLLSVIAYLVATNTELNFLEQREAVNLTLQVAVAVGALLALLAAADAISGERERGTLESLLLTPVAAARDRVGKLLAALSLWLAAFVVTVPYVWFLGRGVGDRRRRARAPASSSARCSRSSSPSLGLVDQRVRGLEPRQPLAQPVRAAGAVRADAAARGAQQGWAGELLLRVEPGHRRRALRRQDRRRTDTAGARTSRGSSRPSSRPWSSPSWRRSWLAGSSRCGEGSPDEARPSRAARARGRSHRLALARSPQARAPRGHAGVSATVDRTSIPTELGRTFVFRSRIANDGRGDGRRTDRPPQHRQPAGRTSTSTPRTGRRTARAISGRSAQAARRPSRGA